MSLPSLLVLARRDAPSALYFLNFESHAILHDVRGGTQREPSGALSSSFSHSARQASSAVALVVVAEAHFPSGAEGAFGVAGAEDAEVIGAPVLEDDGDGSFAGGELPQATRVRTHERESTVRMSPL